jgi:preprotein translocase SecE subunit
MNIATQFVKEAFYELKKASWLSRKEATGSTRAVILLVCLVSIYVASIDFILSIVLGSILGR